MSDDAKDSKDLSGPQDHEPPHPRLSLIGFFGDSDKPGHRRLYFTTNLDYYVEFKIDDALGAVSIPPERAPFLGAEATKVTLREGAILSYTRTTRARAFDEFDIDLRSMPRRGYGRPHLRAAATDWGTCGQECGSYAGTCETCGGETCATCDQDTCHGGTCEATYCCAPATQDGVTCPHNTCYCTLGCGHPSQIDTACVTNCVTECQPTCPPSP